MKNGTQSNNLTLVNSAGQKMGEAADVFDPSLGASAAIMGVNPVLSKPDVRTVSIFMAVSLACATAAIATGTYAIWLARQKAARKTFTDVQDILRLCQDRMHQMEDDLSHLPHGLVTLN